MKKQPRTMQEIQQEYAAMCTQVGELYLRQLAQDAGILKQYLALNKEAEKTAAAMPASAEPATGEVKS